MKVNILRYLDSGNIQKNAQRTPKVNQIYHPQNILLPIFAVSKMHKQLILPPVEVIKNLINTPPMLVENKPYAFLVTILKQGLHIDGFISKVNSTPKKIFTENNFLLEGDTLRRPKSLLVTGCSILQL